MRQRSPPKKTSLCFNCGSHTAVWNDSGRTRELSAKGMPYRFVCDRPLLIGFLESRGEQVDLRLHLASSPVGPQRLEKFGGKSQFPVARILSLLDMDDHALTVDIGDLQLRSFGSPEIESKIGSITVSYAALRFARLANGDGALPALIAAQRFLAASAMALRPAALRVRFCFAGAFATGFLPDPGGRPRRLGPCNASIARFSLSRSAINRATICSMGIIPMVAHDACCQFGKAGQERPPAATCSMTRHATGFSLLADESRLVEPANRFRKPVLAPL